MWCEGMVSRRVLFFTAVALLAMAETMWLLSAMRGRDDASDMPTWEWQGEHRGQDQIVGRGGEASTSVGRTAAEGLGGMRYYWEEEEQPVVGSLTGNMVMVHMGRCGSTLVQRHVTTKLLSQHHGENLMEVLEAENVLLVMRKYLEVRRSGSKAALQRLESAIGGRLVEEAFRLEAAVPDDVYSPGNSLQFGEMTKRSGEEYEALVFALRFLTAPPAGSDRKMTMSSLKVWAICGVGFSVEQYFEALHEAGVAHVVVVHRNYLRRLLSARAAEVSGRWHAMAQENANCKQTVVIDTQKQGKCDPQRQHTMIGLFRMSDAAYQELFTGRVAALFPDAVVLSYENDIYPTGGAQAVRKILRHFGTDVTELQDLATGLVKTTDCALKEVIENFDEVKQVLEGTRWRYCLEEAGGQAVVDSPIELVLRPPAEPRSHLQQDIGPH